MQERQIFQTQSARRWKRFKWSTRLLILLIPAALLMFFITAMRFKMANMPRLKTVVYRPLKDTQSFVYRNSELARKYYGFRKFIDDKSKIAEGGKPRPLPTEAAAIRAGFFVDWDPQSYYSLQRNIKKLNLVIPEWLFINPNADTVYSNIDARAFDVMKKAGVSIMPMLSNNYREVFRGDAVHRIITDPVKKTRLIHDLVRILKQNGFSGVNVDFEDLQENSDEALISFQKDLYASLHAEGLLVTQDVIPFNEDYNYKALSAYNDFLFVMAYDEFSESTRSGPISEQKWIEAAVEQALKHLPASKVILGLAAYGYDWPKNDEALSLTYQQALINAKEAGAAISFDNDTYNLHYNYSDDNGVAHEVYFTDAATSFNTMRFADESGLAGVALWRLGSEDPRVWEFYNLPMDRSILQKFNFTEFSAVKATEDADYNGQGEVLDVVATPTKGKIRIELDGNDGLISEESYDSLPSMFVVNAYGWNPADTLRNKKKIVLTFDDGPDPEWTPAILDILSKEKVPATFFVVGKNVEENIPLLKRIYREGHEIGNHTFTHPNIAAVSTRRAVVEMEATRLLIECITGHSTVLFRAPYNADFQPEKWEELQPVALARNKNYLDVGESIDPLDWEPGVSADSIVQRVIDRKLELNASNQGGNIILLHDAGGNSRLATIQALPRIIQYFKSQGYSFTTIADYLGKKKADLMPAVPKGSGFYWIQANAVFIEATYWASTILFSLFVIFIILSIARIITMGVLAIREKKLEALPLAAFNGEYPLVSIIVPAYNEEVNAVSSLNNLLRSRYPNFNIVFVDDGSKDSTYQKVMDAFREHPKVEVLTKPNGGKAAALNFGINRTSAEYVVCIDADTQLHPDAITAMMRHFLADAEKEIGAVAGNVKVGNEVNVLTRWQAIEYISSQNFDRRAFAYLNAITVVPGAVGAFRKKAIEDAGGFTTDTLAEDCDITIRIISSGYVVRNENGALAFTEVPEKLSQFIKQRFRWSFGVLQTLWKHRRKFFNRRYRWLGYVALPNILLFQYIIPAFIPLADLFMLVGAVTGNASRIFPYYLAFMAVDAGMAMLAFRMEEEKLSRLVWLIPQRLIYRWFMWWVLFKSCRRAMKGELQSWGVLKRTGTVQEPQPAT